MELETYHCPLLLSLFFYLYLLNFVEKIWQTRQIIVYFYKITILIKVTKLLNTDRNAKQWYPKKKDFIIIS